MLRDSHTTGQEGEWLRLDPPEGASSAPHHRRSGSADHAGVGNHIWQRQRLGHASKACLAGSGSRTSISAYPSSMQAKGAARVAAVKRCPAWGFPSTGQRRDAASLDKTDRYKTARILDAPKHKRNNMGKGALGAEETSRYQAHYRFAIKLDRRRFDRIRSTA